MNTPKIIEYNKKRLLTTEQLAEFYGTTTDRIKQNISRNKKKFVEGKHYYLLKGDELKDFKNSVSNSYLVDKHSPQIYLWTKQGASRHSKILNTDRAWDMFDELEENYFSPKPQITIPTTHREMAQLALAVTEETNQRVDGLDERLTEIEDNKLISTEDKNSIDRMIRRKVAVICKEQHLDQQAKKLLFTDIGRSIKELFKVPHRGRIKDKDFQRVVDFVNVWEPSSVTKTQIGQLNLDIG